MVWKQCAPVHTEVPRGVLALYTAENRLLERPKALRMYVVFTIVELLAKEERPKSSETMVGTKPCPKPKVSPAGGYNV